MGVLTTGGGLFDLQKNRLMFGFDACCVGKAESGMFFRGSVQVLKL